MVVLYKVLIYQSLKVHDVLKADSNWIDVEYPIRLPSVSLEKNVLLANLLGYV